MEVLTFAIFIVLNAVFVTLTVLVVSALTGHFREAALALASYVILRFFSGGMHLPTSNLCNFVSTGVFLLLVHLPVPFWNAGFLLNALALVLVLAYAPTKDIMHLNRLGPKYTIHFKITSIVLVLLNFWIQSPIISMAYFVQAVSLTPPAYKAVERLERR